VHAIRIDRPGGYARLHWVEQPDPEPGRGEVRLAVHAAGVNYADGIIRMGLYASARVLHGYPITPGFEVAGTVDAVGEAVEAWQVGDRALALTLFGGYAEYVVVPTVQLFRLPAGLSLEQAAALPTVFLTAWFLAQRKLQPEPGDRWLVHSAAGGVGNALLQLGRLAGCRCIGVVGNREKVAYARRSGAEAVIVRSDGPWWESARRFADAGYQAVFDACGVATLRHSYALLAPAGTLLIYGFHSMLPRDGRVRWLRLAWDWLRTPRFSPLDMTQSNRSVIAANLSFLQAHAGSLRTGMEWLLARFAQGQLQPPEIRCLPMQHAAEAQRAIESGATQGKLVLTTERFRSAAPAAGSAPTG
jgi:NADPH:quinone reductase-like Zn-dependent oxidoreductase